MAAPELPQNGVAVAAAFAALAAQQLPSGTMPNWTRRLGLLDSHARDREGRKEATAPPPSPTEARRAGKKALSLRPSVRSSVVRPDHRISRVRACRAVRNAKQRSTQASRVTQWDDGRSLLKTLRDPQFYMGTPTHSYGFNWVHLLSYVKCFI